MYLESFGRIYRALDEFWKDPNGFRNIRTERKGLDGGLGWTPRSGRNHKGPDEFREIWMDLERFVSIKLIKYLFLQQQQKYYIL